MAANGHLEHQRKKSGMPPGVLQHIGQRHRDDAKITAIEYADEAYSCRELKDLAVPRAFGEHSVLWLNVDGIHEPKVLEELGKTFSLHPLVLEDVMNAEMRPKLEEYDDCLFVVLKMLDYDAKEGRIMVEQVSFILKEDALITFQERAGDVFDSVRERLKNNAGKIRKVKADYLAYRLIDAIVDHYFVALEAMTELVDEMEEKVAEDPTRVDNRDLHVLRREALYLRKAIVPARELLGTLARIEDTPLVRPATMPYLRDVYDHILQVNETLETVRDALASMLDVYHAAVSNKMNEVMKTLSIVSTVFIPLTFVAGIYGMNFDVMPELRQAWGYPLVLLLMALLGAGIVLYTKRKRWW